MLQIRRIFPRPDARYLLVMLAALAFAVKVFLALHTLGSFDTLTWQRDLDLIHAQGVPALYREGISYFSPEGRLLIEQPFIHPPFVIHLLRVWEFLSNSTSFPIQFWIRLTCALADGCSLLLLAGILRQSGVGRVLSRLCVFAICPAAILISGFHGNTDPIMMMFVLASIYLIECRRAPWAAGVPLGMALNIKLAAVLFMPAIFLGISGFRKKLELGTIAAVTMLAGSIPYIFQEPRLILTRLGEYKSQFGTWGIGRLCSAFGHGDSLNLECEAYRLYGGYSVLLLITVLTIWKSKRRSKAPLFEHCGLAAFIFLALTPGFGVQYLAWSIPFAALLTGWPAALYHIVTGGFLAAYYYRVTHAWPAYLASTFDQPAWYGHVLYLGFLCWIVICVNAFVLVKPASHGPDVVRVDQNSTSRSAKA
ncbi:MAG: hypothetical protein ACE145_04040 [Terriglobia bacterium]